MTSYTTARNREATGGIPARGIPVGSSRSPRASLGKPGSHTEFLESRTFLSASGPFPRVDIDPIPPAASLQPVSLANRGDPQFFFTVDYTDNLRIIVSTIGDDDLFVTGPNGFAANAHFIGDPRSLTDGPAQSIQYAIDAPLTSGFTDADAGTYTISVSDPGGATDGPVMDGGDNPISAGVIGTFDLQFPVLPGPDLTVTDVSYPAGQYAAGGSIVFQATVRNLGQLPADPSQVVISLFSPNDQPVVDLATTSISQTLASGASVPLKLTATIPAGTIAGEYFLSARVVPAEDPNGTPLDIDPSNNFFTSTTPNVMVAPPTSPPPPIGGLDPTFGFNGVLKQDTALANTAAVAVQADGKTVVVGDADGTSTLDFAVTRLNVDGTIDTTFGGTTLGGPFDGTVFTDFNGRDDHAIGVQIQADGKILVAGTSRSVPGATDGDFVLVRYNTDGSLDSTFATGGIAITDFGLSGASNDQALGMTLLPDGRIVVPGRSNAAGTGDDFALALYAANGALDPSFGGTGKVLTDFAGGDDSAYAVAFDARRNQLVVGGSTKPAGGVAGMFALARYNADGSLDAKFGTAGKVSTTVFGADDEAYALEIGPKGEVVAAGAATTVDQTSTDFAIVRFTSKGALDRKFGTGGRATVSFGQPAVANQVQIGVDSSILVAGSTATSFDTVDPEHLAIAIAQLTPAGALDTTFNPTGPIPGTSIVNFDTAGSTSTTIQSASVQAFATPFEVTASQQAQAVLVKQKAIAKALSGKLVVVGTTGDQTAIGQITGSAPDLTGTLTAVLPATIVASASKGSATFTLTNSGNRAAAGVATITFYVSLDPNVDAGDVPLSTQTNRKIKLKAGQSKNFKAKFLIPATLADGSYFIIANVDAGATITEVSTANNTAATLAAVPIAAPFLDFSGPALATPPPVTHGGKLTVPVTVMNDGNIVANGTIGVRIVAADPLGVAADVVLMDLPAVKVKINPGSAKTLKIKVVIPDTLTPGSYTLKATINGGLAANDPTPANNVLTAAGFLVVM